MKEIKVKILEEYRGHVDPERKYHLVDIETGKEPVQNLKMQEIPHFIKKFHLTLVETEDMKNGKKNDDLFDFKIVAEGNFRNEGIIISTIVIRLNGTAMNDWIMSNILNSRDTYETEEEWEVYKAKTAERRKVWERNILDKLKFTADTGTGYTITQSVSEIFTVVLKKPPCCENCMNFSTEGGAELCKFWETPMEDVSNDKCSEWC